MSIHARAASSILLAATLAACEADAPGEDPLIDTRAADPVVATRSSSTLGAAAGLTRLGNAFRANEQSVENLGPDAVVALQFGLVVAALEIWYERTLGCDHEGRLVTTDRTLTANFDESCNGITRARGSFTASVELEQVECDDEDGLCPSGITWTLVADALELSNPRRTFSPIYDGTMTLRSPLVDAEPMTWTTEPDFSMEFGVGTIAVESEASWHYDRMTECIDAELSGRLRVLEGADDLDERIGEVVLEVDDYRKCADMCPESGNVNLLYGYGEVLRWFYDGGDEARVTGPRGRQLEVGLPCGM